MGESDTTTRIEVERLAAEPPAADGLSPAPEERADLPAPRYLPGSPGPVPADVKSPAARLLRAVAHAAEAERGHGLPFLFVPVALGAGAMLQFSLPREPDLWPMAVLLALLSAGAVLARRRSSVAAYPAAFAAVALLGMIASGIETRGGPTLLDSDVTTTVTGRIEAVEIDTAGAARYLLRLEKAADPEIRRLPERVRISTRSTTPPFPVGSRITGRARLGPPSGPAFPGGFDFAFHAFTTGIGAYGFFHAPPQAAEGEGTADATSRVAERLSATRAAIAHRIRSIVPGDAGGIAAALTVSDRRGISEPVAEALRATGLAHILSISGLHMALAAGLSFVGLRRAMALSPRLAETLPVKKIAAFGALAVSSAYFVISGGDVATQRSFLMMVVFLGAALLDRTALTMRNIALSAIVVLLIEPSSVTSPGFQMSYAATAGLMAAYAAWSRRRAAEEGTMVLPRGGLARAVAAGVLGLAFTSLVAGLSSGLYAAYHFHRASFSGLLANLLAMPFVSFVVMPAGLVAMLAMPFGLDAVPLKVMGLGLEGVIAVATGVAGLGGEAAVGRVPVSAMLVATAGFLLLVFLRGRLALAGGLVLAAGLAMSLPAFRPAPPRLLVTEDGALVGMLSGTTFATNAARPTDFTFRQWQMAHGAPSHVPPLPAAKPDVAETPSARLDRLLAAAAENPARFVCASRRACAGIVDGVRIVAIGEGDLIGPACDRADLVVVALPVRLAACRSDGLLVTARTLRRTGALAIRIAPVDEEVTGRNAQGRLEIETTLEGVVRPWTVQRYYDWRADRYDLPDDAGAKPVAREAEVSPPLNGSGG